MRHWQLMTILVALFPLHTRAQDQRNDDPAAEATSIPAGSETAEQMRRRFLELAKKRADEMSIAELQFKMGELNRELRESEAEKSLQQIDEALTKVIRTFPNTFAARRAALALTALREPPTRLPPRVPVSSSSAADENLPQVEQVINIEALQRRLRQSP